MRRYLLCKSYEWHGLCTQECIQYLKRLHPSNPSIRGGDCRSVRSCIAALKVPRCSMLDSCPKGGPKPAVLSLHLKKSQSIVFHCTILSNLCEFPQLTARPGGAKAVMSLYAKKIQSILFHYSVHPLEVPLTIADLSQPLHMSCSLLDLMAQVQPSSLPCTHVTSRRA